MTTPTTAQMRRALIAAGQKPSAMSDAEIAAAYDALPVTPAAPAKPIAAKPEPVTPAAKPVPADQIAAAIQAAISAAMAGFAGQLDEGRVIELIAQHGSKEAVLIHHIDLHIDSKPHGKIENCHPALAKVLDILKIGEKPYMTGEAGSGKTSIAQQAAEAMGRAFYSTNAVADEFGLLGYMDGNGHYHRTPFRDAIEFGGVFLFDEMDGSDPRALLCFNAALENGFVTFPDNKTFQIDYSEVLIIAAANTKGRGATRRYSGRSVIDEATRSRFVEVVVDYDQGIELAMAKAAWLKAGGAEDNLPVAQAWANTVIDFRKQLVDRGIDILITPRASRQGAKLLAIGWDKADVISTVLHRDLSADQIKQFTV